MPGQLGGPASSATVTERVRSYLHANCAFCHRPDGEFRSVDLRYDTTFKDTMLCNAIPAKGTLGVANATNLTPGHPELSTIWLRMDTLGNGRMPPLASAVKDQDVVDLMGAGSTACKPAREARRRGGIVRDRPAVSARHRPVIYEPFNAPVITAGA